MEEKKALLVVSVGTTLWEAEKACIMPVEKALAAAFPARQPYRAWSGRRILQLMRQRHGRVIDNVEEAMLCMARNGVTDVLIQPTYLLPGMEDNAMRLSAAAHAEKFAAVRIGQPLLMSEADRTAVAGFLKKQYVPAEDEAVVFMGHGANRLGPEYYGSVAERLPEPMYLALWNGTPSFDDILERLKQKPEIRRVRLVPFMLAAGSHVSRDMAGDRPDSWKSRLQQAGFETKCVFRGLGESEEIRNLLIAHAKAAENEG